ncbi:hypothetical protein BGZ58_008133 [Dissophora ornata]|nr:hypothetical protein BGZ58_008133 [Dissophora ornata]
MNPASWKPLRGSALRNAAAVTSSIRSSATTVRSGGLRFYQHHSGSTSIGAPCTNSVRKTLYSSGPRHHSRLATLHPSSAVFSNGSSSSRFAPVVRRGFADNAATKAASSQHSEAVAATTAAAGAVQSKSSGFMDKIKQLIKQYGYTGVAVYFGISMVDLAATFVVVKAAGMEKIEKGQDWVVEHIGGYFGYKRNPDRTHASENKDVGDGAGFNKASGLWSVFVIAYGIHKLLVPFRVVATSMITPPLVKWLVKKGWINEVVKKGAVTAGAATTAAATTKP